MGPRGQGAGTIATSPKEVDSILMKSLGKIYDGATDDTEKVAREYVKNYDKYVSKHKTAKISIQKGKDLEITAEEMRESASGLDTWAPVELKMLLPIAYEQLAVPLNLIEKGSPRPEDIS